MSDEILLSWNQKSAKIVIVKKRVRRLDSKLGIVTRRAFVVAARK